MRLGDWALMAIVALTWSGGWVAGKIGVNTVPPLALSSVRFLIAGACLLALARISGARVPWERWPALLALGATGILGYNAFVFIGLVDAPATDGGLIVPTLTPPLAAVLAAPFAGEPLTRSKVAGLLLAMCGVAVIVLSGNGLAEGGAARLRGDLLIVFGALCWAIYTVLGKAVLRHASPLAVTAAAAVLGGLMLLPLAALEGGLAAVPGWPPRAWAAVGFLVLFPTIIGFVLFYRVVVRLGAARAAMTSYLVPVGTLALAALLLREEIIPLQLAGAAITIAGMRVASVPEGEQFWLRRLVGV